MHSYNRTTKDTNFRYHIVHSQQMLQSYYSLTVDKIIVHSLLRQKSSVYGQLPKGEIRR